MSHLSNEMKKHGLSFSLIDDGRRAACYAKTKALTAIKNELIMANISYNPIHGGLTVEKEDFTKIRALGVGIDQAVAAQPVLAGPAQSGSWAQSLERDGGPLTDGRGNPLHR